jgi:hypothetical protein
MDFAQAFIFDAGWLFFAGWMIVLALISVIAFRQDLSSLLGRENIRPQITKIR